MELLKVELQNSRGKNMGKNPKGSKKYLKKN